MRPAVAAEFNDINKTPERYLLWFHHVSWDYKMPSGRTLWDELVYRYSHGVEEVQSMEVTWAATKPYVDPQRFDEVSAFLRIQEKEARWWRDGEPCVLRDVLEAADQGRARSTLARAELL